MDEVGRKCKSISEAEVFAFVSPGLFLAIIGLKAGWLVGWDYYLNQNPGDKLCTDY